MQRSGDWLAEGWATVSMLSVRHVWLRTRSADVQQTRLSLIMEEFTVLAVASADVKTGTSAGTMLNDRFDSSLKLHQASLMEASVV
jgi:hypothetical protein